MVWVKISNETEDLVRVRTKNKNGYTIIELEGHKNGMRVKTGKQINYYNACNWHMCQLTVYMVCKVL